MSINDSIKNLSINEKIGQMLMVGMDTTNIKPKLKELILKYKVGGIMLYKKNYKNYEEMISIINYIKEINKSNKIPILIAIDQEAGRVNRMPINFLNLPSQNRLAKSGEEYIRNSAKISAEMLNKTGINMNFSPVLDIKRFPDNHAIGDRAYSDKIDDIINYGSIYVNSMKKENIIPVIKHFPGHGTVKKDTHFLVTGIKQNLSDLEKTDIFVFKEVIKKGADTMLVSHLRLNSIDRKNPSSMSKKLVSQYIRKKMRYNKVLITDDMRMKGVIVLYGKYQPILKSIKSGIDITLFKYIENDKIFKKIEKSIEKNKIKEHQINRSVKRILQLKDNYNINDNPIIFDKTFVNNINSKIEKIKNKVENS